MKIDVIPLYRGIGLRKGIVIQNPFEIRNPGREAGEGVFFHAMSFEWLAREASEELAQIIEARRPDHEPRVIKFGLTPMAFQVLEGRIRDHVGIGYEWRRVSRFEDLWPRQSGELTINGNGLSSSELSMLGIELGRRSEAGWVYEPFISSPAQAEARFISGERARI